LGWFEADLSLTIGLCMESTIVWLGDARASAALTSLCTALTPYLRRSKVLEAVVRQTASMRVQFEFYLGQHTATPLAVSIF
jgi:hypothetical protein